MDENQIGTFVSSNSVVGAGIAAALATLYKIWQILKTDRKEANLDNAERSLRDELRIEVKELRDLNEKLRLENIVLHESVADLKAQFKFCQANHPTICPLVKMRGMPQAQNAQEGR